MPEDFVTPSGWTLDRPAGVPVLTGPEGDLTMVFVDLPPEPDVQATALAAWRRIDPAFASRVAREAAIPVQGSWESSHQVLYETPAAESRIELAFVRHLGGRAYVCLVRGSLAAMSRRGAQLMEAAGSWKPEGYREISLAGATVVDWGDSHSAMFSEFIRAGMAAMQIPGVSVAIAQHGKIAWTGAFGVRGLDEDQPVTAQTRFMIGSATKPLTTLLMARLIDQGKAAWSTPVCDLLPAFALADPGITRRLELRHTASASTGMPRRDADFVFQYSGITAEQRIAQMKAMSPTTGFGETFQYSNFLVAAGGYAAARVCSPSLPLEEAYESAMASEVFGPLEMRDSFLRQEDALRGDAALPHALNFDGVITRIPLHTEKAVYSVAPAGAAWSTASDMARYVMLELGQGCLPGGRRVISEEALLERRKPGIKIDEDSSYGLGLFVSNEAGIPVIHHGGNTFGFSADVFFLPAHDFGVVVLTNAFQANLFLLAVRQKIFEIALGAEPRAAKTLETSAKLMQESVAALRKKVVTDAAEMKWGEEILGRYVCAELGSATIEKRGDGYWIQCEEWGSPLGGEVQPSGDRLLRALAAPWRGTIRWIVSPDGQSLTFDQGQQKYEFRRQP